MPRPIRDKQGRKRVLIVVLGDLGRSPRMQYHSLSLDSQAGLEVDILAQGGSQPLEGLRSSPHVQIHTLPDTPAWLAKLPSTLRLPLKLFLQTLQILWLLLFSLPSPDAILLQVPPALPTLPLCRAAALWHSCPLVIDWHNFAHTLMALSLSPHHPAVRIARQQERFWGRQAARSLCVTQAMQEHLKSEWDIQATVFHDRAPEQFRPLAVAGQHALMARLWQDMRLPMHPHDWCSQQMTRLSQGCTLFTQLEPDGTPVLRSDRPALVVSSTSWTPDEDFGLLLDALQLYDAQAQKRSAQQASILLCVTGKGPQRAAFQQRMKALDLRRVACRTLWLEPADYPRLLGMADLGVCLHTSSSGLDLPMKVVDMFGCSLPVCALDYSCIRELVKDGEHGLLFSSAQQLAQNLLLLLDGFPGKQHGKLQQMRSNLREHPFPGWADAWEQNVMPVFRELVGHEA